MTSLEVNRNHEENKVFIGYSEECLELVNNSWKNTNCEKKVFALQVSVLESVENPKQVVVVGVTHLYFRPEADHIRLLQSGLSLQILQQVMGLYQNKVSIRKKGWRVRKGSENFFFHHGCCLTSLWIEWLEK